MTPPLDIAKHAQDAFSGFDLSTSHEQALKNYALSMVRLCGGRENAKQLIESEGWQAMLDNTKYHRDLDSAMRELLRTGAEQADSLTMQSEVLPNEDH